MPSENAKAIGFGPKQITFDERLKRSRLLFVFSAAVSIMVSSASPAAAQIQSREENTDRVGRDYRHFDLDLPSPGILGGPEDVCREICQRDNMCKAWTFAKAGFQGPKPTCWLKNAIPTPRPSNCCVSGVPVRSFEPDVDRPGKDYNNFDLAAADANLCKAACEKDGVKCQAWTYTKPGTQGPKPRCWLKNTIPPGSTNSCCTSGVRATIVH